MNDFEVGIVGSSLQAAMIGGLLKHTHGKRVCLFLDRSVQYGLAREMALSFDFFTRPQTWEILDQSLGETLSVLTKIGGADILLHANALIVCNSSASATALEHIFQLFRGTGKDIERAPETGHGKAKAVFRLRNVRAIRTKTLWPALFNWLENLNVGFFNPTDLHITSHRDGTASIRTSSGTLHVERLVLADQKAICNFAPQNDVNRLFFETPASSLITEPVDGLSQSLVLSPEFRFAGRARENGSLEIIANTHMENVGGILHANMPGDLSFRRAGRTQFSALVSRDGAPVAGKLGRGALWGIAGFGYPSVFFASALARLIADQSNSREQAYFKLRDGTAMRNIAHVADFNSGASVQAK